MEKPPSLQPIIISPPFGTYINHPRASSVHGSFTLARRPGRGWRILQFALDNLIWPVAGGWRNRIGLRNPGITSVTFDRDHIWSLVGLDMEDWETFLVLFDDLPDRYIENVFLELNLGCMNVHEYTIRENILTKYCQRYKVIIKLPSEYNKAMPLAEIGARAGVHFFHCCNTYPSERGGISGMPLKPVNLLVVEDVAKRYPATPVIGGGGIYSFEDLRDYHNAGAQKFSLATIWFRPGMAMKIIDDFYQSPLYRPGLVE